MSGAQTRTGIFATWPANPSLKPSPIAKNASNERANYVGERAEDIYTVASERLRPITDPTNFNNPIYPKLSADDLTAISLLVRKALLRILTVSLPPAPSTSTARPAPTR